MKLGLIIPANIYSISESSKIGGKIGWFEKSFIKKYI